MRSQSDAVAEAFYNRLFELDPNLKLLFHGNMREQRSQLMEAIGTVVAHLDHFEEVKPLLRKLAIRHVDYGVKAGDYEVVGDSLLWALDRALTPNFTSDAREAWKEAYLLLYTSMKEAAHAKHMLGDQRKAPIT